MNVRESRAVDRPAVLIVEAEAERRHALAYGLAEGGYDVTPAMTAEEGLKFARGLGPSVIVGPVALISESGGEILQHCVPGHALERTILLLGDAADGLELPDEVRFLAVEGLADEEILHRVRLVLLGREIGVETDLELSSLVGELALVPFLELVRSLHRCKLTGRLHLIDGHVAFDRGAVIAAGLREVRTTVAGLAANAVRGVKAFCRLARRAEGPFRIVLGPPGEEPEIYDQVPDLVMRALEELQVDLPPLRTRLRMMRGGSVPTEPFATHQNLLLEMVSHCLTVGELLDSVPSTDGRLVQALDKMVASGFVKLERPRCDVAVVTDSAADLPQDLAHEHDIAVVPLAVVFGEEALRDGVDIQPRDFYQMLDSEKHHPATLAPTEAEILEHYLARIEDQDVVAVHVSPKLSRTLEHARRAARKGQREIAQPARRSGLRVVDSQSAGVGLGLLALFAARMAYRGVEAGAIAQRLEAMTARVHVLFAVEDLEYLKRAGHIGLARARLGELLRIKPIVGLVEGALEVIDRVLGGRQAEARLVKLLSERLAPGRPVVAAVAHARAPVWGDRLRHLLAQSFDVAELIVTDIGPVVGTHVGPGAVGAAVFQPSPEEWELIAPLA